MRKYQLWTVARLGREDGASGAHRNSKLPAIDARDWLLPGVSTRTSALRKTTAEPRAVRRARSVKTTGLSAEGTPETSMSSRCSGANMLLILIPRAAHHAANSGS